MESYKWQDNSTEPFYNVIASGLYFIDVISTDGCPGSDTVYVEVGSTVNILDDSLLVCTGETITIDAGYGFDFYTWSNGDYGVQSIDVTEGNKYYSVDVNYFYGCPSSDSVYVSELPKPEAVISGADQICSGDTLFLTAPTGPFIYSWNGGPLSDQASYLVQQGGDYTLTMSNACGQSNDEVYIQENPLPQPDLGPDVLLFPDESITLTPGNFTTYLWQDGSNQSSYAVSYGDISVLDTVWVEVFDGLCKNTDKIKVEVFNVEIPNAITPNGDSYNDRFEPTSPLTGVNNHTMTVFNRWGQIVWESNNFADGWDGKQNGRYVDEGTYFWILEVNYGNDNIKKIYKGSLTILGTGS
ncbi:MAG: gliding motility-associated C-terminal domain-containing protein [Bacteroidales bacterium]